MTRKTVHNDRLVAPARLNALALLFAQRRFQARRCLPAGERYGCFRSLERYVLYKLPRAKLLTTTCRTPLNLPSIYFVHYASQGVAGFEGGIRGGLYAARVGERGRKEAGHASRGVPQGMIGETTDEILFYVLICLAVS